EKLLGDMLDLDDLHVEFAPDLVAMVLDSATGLDARINNMRSHVAEEFGLILPEIRLTDNAILTPGSYVMRIQGVEQAHDRLFPDMVLALMSDNPDQLPPGEDVQEPVYGAQARWISREHQDSAAVTGATIVAPAEVLATHLLEVIKKNFPRLLTLKSLNKLLTEFTNLSDQGRAAGNKRLLDDLIPEKVPVDLLLSVMRLLLEERVSVRNLPLILESIAEARGTAATPESISEHVRQRLGFQLIAEMKRPDGSLPLLQLAPEWEDTFDTYQIEGERGQVDVALPPDDFNKLANGVAEKIATAGNDGVYPALITSRLRRRFLRTVLSSRGIQNPVFSFEEIGTDSKPALIGMVPA
ncbi:MAG: FHIPEP family type III secretion protein, partial [Halocynthiibacter sp.]